jgi:hypothetical protein
MNLRRAIRRLRLKKGDILVVREPETARRLAGSGKDLGLNFNVPIVVIPEKYKVKHG